MLYFAVFTQSRTQNRLALLLELLQFSRFPNFNRYFRMETGLTPRSYRSAARIRAKSLVTAPTPQRNRTA